jgi:hypothetical protein
MTSMISEEVRYLATLIAAASGMGGDATRALAEFASDVINSDALNAAATPEEEAMASPLQVWAVRIVRKAMETATGILEAVTAELEKARREVSEARGLWGFADGELLDAKTTVKRARMGVVRAIERLTPYATTLPTTIDEFSAAVRTSISAWKVCYRALDVTKIYEQDPKHYEDETRLMDHVGASLITNALLVDIIDSAKKNVWLLSATLIQLFHGDLPELGVVSVPPPPAETATVSVAEAAPIPAAELTPEERALASFLGVRVAAPVLVAEDD